MTPELIVVVAFLWLFSDVLLFQRLGNDATYSKTLLRLASTTYGRFIVSGIPYILGVLCGHLFNPTFAAEPPLWELLIRLSLACFPLFIVAYRIWTGPQATDAQLSAMYSGKNRYWAGIKLVCWFGLGVASGATLVPQHLVLVNFDDVPDQIPLAGD